MGEPRFVMVSRRLATITPARMTADLAAAEQDIAAVLARCALHPADRILESMHNKQIWLSNEPKRSCRGMAFIPF